MHPQISQVAGNAPHFSPLLGALRPFRRAVATNFTLCSLLAGSHLTHLGMHAWKIRLGLFALKQFALDAWVDFYAELVTV